MLLLTSVQSYSQNTMHKYETKSPHETVVGGDTFMHTSGILVNEYLSKLPAVDIEQRMIGKWKFIELQDMDGHRIDTVIQTVVERGAKFARVVKVKFESPDLRFYPDMTFRVVGIYKGHDLVTGTWFYSDTFGGLDLKFNLPNYESSEDSALMVAEHLPLRHREVRFIRNVTDKELFLINILPVRKGQSGYNIEYYRKED